jgi:hypothetical protein
MKRFQFAIHRRPWSWGRLSCQRYKSRSLYYLQLWIFRRVIVLGWDASSR